MQTLTLIPQRNGPSYRKHHIAAIILLIVVALNAMAAGYSFIADPSGKGLGITTDYLRTSAPFKDYFIPGLALFILNGILSLVVAVLAIVKHKGYPLFISLQGGVFALWIIIQLLMVESFHPLHAIVAFIGLTLIILGWLINQRRGA